MVQLHRRGLLKGRVLDYGCGRGHDAQHFDIFGYDPHWQPIMPAGCFDTITCIYVLNVVTEEVQAEILEKIPSHLVPGGHAYLAVRRDLPKEGKQGRGVFQRFVVLDLPVLAQNSGYAIYDLMG